MKNSTMHLDEQLDLLVKRNQKLIDALRNLRKRLDVEEPGDEQNRTEVLPEERHDKKEDER